MASIPTDSLHNLQQQLFTYQSTISSNKNKMDELQREIRISKLQIEMFTKESYRARQAISRCRLGITQEQFSEIGQISEPSGMERVLAEKFMVMLGHKNPKWGDFLELVKDYQTLTELIRTISAETLSDSQFQQVYLIWKERQQFQTEFRSNPGLTCILNWLVQYIELKVLKDNLNVSKIQLHEVFYRQLDSEFRTLKKQTEIVTVKYRQLSNRVQGLLFIGHKKQISVHSEPTQLQRSRSQAVKRVKPMHLDTTEEMDNLSREEITYADYFSGNLPDETFQIILEGAGESRGCCRSRFFCFMQN